MSQNTNSNGFDKGSLFSFLYRTRIKVMKGNTTIVNLSVIFSVIALLSAPWLVIIGAMVALALGYRFSMERNAEGFSGSFGNVVRGAASTVKSAVESFTSEQGEAQNGAKDDEYTQQ